LQWSVDLQKCFNGVLIKNEVGSIFHHISFTPYPSLQKPLLVDHFLPVSLLEHHYYSRPRGETKKLIGKPFSLPRKWKLESPTGVACKGLAYFPGSNHAVFASTPGGLVDLRHSLAKARLTVFRGRIA
jgi:hypothetical protein